MLLQQRQVSLIVLLAVLFFESVHPPCYSQPATLEQLQALRLHSPFTMVFAVNIVPIAGPNTSSGQLAPPSPAHYQILLSYSNHKLLYEQLQGSVNTVAIYDGRKLSLCASNSSLAEVYPTLNFSMVGDLPFPAVGMPNIPFIEPLDPIEQIRFKGTAMNGCIPTSAQGSTRTIEYMPAVVNSSTVGGTDRITRATVGFPGHIVDQWQFSEYQPFQGLWVATTSKHINYELRKPVNARGPITWAQLASVPTYSCIYTLKRISNDPLPDSAFDFRNHLKPFTNIQDYSSGASAATIQAYPYDPEGGSLDDQEAKQHFRDQEVNDKSRTWRSKYRTYAKS